MNRFDWYQVLTKGYRPPKQNIEKKKTRTKPVKENDTVTTDLKDVGESSADYEDMSENETGNVSGEENACIESKAEVKKGKVKSKEKLALIKQEQINHFRNINNINVNGTDVPAPVETFEQLTSEFNVKRQIVENLLMEKYQNPTPIQMQAWSLLLKRREVLACAPTGSGKTAGFLLPIIHHLKSPRTKGFRALILAPTRELAKQIVRECDRLSEGSGLKSGIINKTKGAFCTTFYKKFDILVTTPNKLIYILQEEEKVQKVLEKVEWLIVDESDKLFEDGKNGFRDQLATIFRACSGPAVLRAMFSATVSFDVEEWCKLNLNNVVTVAIGTRNTCPDVDQSLSFCASSAGKIMEIHNILRKGYEIPCLIFVQTKERAKMLCEEILLTNRPVRCIHSDISQSKRDEIVKEFREKKVWILICTELMGRGIDFKGVNLVINYDFPPSIVSYVHRVGRTGRAGKKGRAITFWSMDDLPLLRSIAHVMKNSGSEVEEWLLTLKNTSTKDRKKYAKMVPDRGGLYEGMKERKRGKKRKPQKQSEEGESKRRKEEPQTSDKENRKGNKKNKKANLATAKSKGGRPRQRKKGKK